MRQGLLARLSSVACAGAIVLAQANANARSSPGSVQKAEASPQASATPAPAVTRPKENPIPDTFVNLQLLPKDITKPELVLLMKQFSITFKVRCSHCHAVSDDLTQGSFDSDEKQTKLEARKYIKMLMAIGQKTGGADCAVPLHLPVP
jgi:hypothetical protein